jgi:hypothetical protein
MMSFSKKKEAMGGSKFSSQLRDPGTYSRFAIKFNPARRLGYRRDCVLSVIQEFRVQAYDPDKEVVTKEHRDMYQTDCDWSYSQERVT